jgi:hypothetical protein
MAGVRNLEDHAISVGVTYWVITPELLGFHMQAKFERLFLVG